MYLRLRDGRNGWKSLSKTLGESCETSCCSREGDTEEDSLLSVLILGSAGGM